MLGGRLAPANARSPTYDKTAFEVPANPNTWPVFMMPAANSSPISDIIPKTAERRAHGEAKAVFVKKHGKTCLSHLHHIWPCRILLPAPPTDGRIEAVIANSGGGVVGGDRMQVKIEAGQGSAVTVTSQAAEKVYRSPTAVVSEMSTDVSVASEARLEWVPHETILFEGARLRRQARLDLSKSAMALCADVIVFGRRARGEGFVEGMLHDEWRVYRDGCLVWADILHLESGLSGSLTNRFSFGNAAAIALVVCQTSNPEAVRDTARRLLGENPDCGFTVVNGLAIGRFVYEDAVRLRRSISELWLGLRPLVGGSGALPRVWEC